jgi:5'-3' exonuclease
MDSKVALIVDGNWFLHRAYHSVGKNTSVPEKKIPVQVVNWTLAAAIKWSASRIGVFFDGDAVFRYEIYPEYKAKRKAGNNGLGMAVYPNKSAEQSLDDGVYKFLPYTQQCLRLCGIYENQEPTFEADDTIAAAAHRWCAQGIEYRAVIVAKDKDSRQNISSQITVYAPGGPGQEDIQWTPSYFFKQTGFTPQQWVRYQILIGDTIDNIPSLMSKKKAASIVKTYSSLKEYFDSSEGAEFYDKNRRQLKLNRLLVTMRRDSWNDNLDELVVKNPNKELLIEEFGTVPNNLNAWLALTTRSRSGGLFSKG